MHTFKKNDLIHRTFYEFKGRKRNGKCDFMLQIKGKGWRKVASGNMVDYSAVIHLLKVNDFKTHEEARELLIQENFLH